MLWEIAASLDLPVFPCKADKTPACAHGFKDAVRLPEEIRTLFASASNADLIGVPTGAISGFDVLDLDVTRHSEAKAWMQEQVFPPTRVNQTQSGGYHVFFKHRIGLRNWTARPVVGVDGRGDGGYIIFWPATGGQTNGRDILEWPQPLIDSCKPAVSKPTRQAKAHPEPINHAKLAGVARAIGRAMNGQRNDLLFWGARRVSEWIDAGDISRTVGERFLISAGRSAGLDDVEIEKTIASAFGWDARHGNSTN